MNELLLGRRMREMRHQRTYTLAELGERTELSKSLLSKIETGQVSPPIATLSKIASALEVPIGFFFEEEARQEHAVLVRADERQAVAESPHGPEYSYEHLASGGAMPRLMEPFIITLEAGTQRRVNLFDHPGEEFIYVLEGEMAFLFGSTSYHMRVGDSLYFDARVPHGPQQIDGRKVSYMAIFTNR